jgi:polysaccharide biosynthesis protein PslG
MRATTVRRVFLFALLVALGTVLRGSERPTPSLEVGLSAHLQWADITNAQGLELLDKAKAAGARWVRFEVSWDHLEQTRGARTPWIVDRMDVIVAAAQARGLKLLPMVWGTPGWANNDRSPNHAPSDPRCYGDILGWLATRYRGRISAWELWNEPNAPEFLAENSAAAYVPLLRAGYLAVKAADPGALVVQAAPPYNNDAWLAQTYDAGAQAYFDVLATHPYMGPGDGAPESSDTGTRTMRHVSVVHELMVSRGDGNKPIWFTEFGWSTHAQPGGVSEAAQADYLIRALRMLRAEYPYVKVAIVYQERDTALGNIQQDNYGVLRRDWTGKPAYEALVDDSS